MRPSTFDKIKFRRRNVSKSVNPLPELLGFDTETYTDGTPFLFCVSDGTSIKPSDIPAAFFGRLYRNRQFAVYNLKFDSGSVLYNMPLSKRKTLAECTRCKWNGYRFTYIPHKCLRISRGKNAVTFWDIAQFYKTSLNTAAQKYLGESKDVLESKIFTPTNVKPQRGRLLEYCVKDAELTARLANYFVGRLSKLHIVPNNLYSQASIAYTYFRSTCGIVDMRRHILFNRKMLAYAYAAYYGGKFEVTARGKFTGYEYDISSAYPYELSRLKDISQAQVRFFKEYVQDADYGFIRVRLDAPASLYHSIPVKHKALSYYPVGRIEAVITKEEYEYLAASGAAPAVIDAWYLFCPKAPARYAAQINYLYGVKQDIARIEPIIRDCAKIILNGFYGKNAQVTEQPKGSYIAGQAFNPVFAAIITAKCRLRVSALQNTLKSDCLAVHTDSILSRKRLAAGFLGTGLGDWTAAGAGEGIIIGCGLYSLAGKNKMRGFTLNKANTWQRILESMGRADRQVLTEHRVMSWVHAAHLDAPERTNVFADVPKMLDLNCDNKRLWLKRTNAAALLSGLEQSIPRVVTQF
jgi:hypothetical protein